MRKAFSLVEILVAVAIIAVLSAISVTGFSKQQKFARDSKRISDGYSIATALESYRGLYNSFPSDNGASATGKAISDNLNVLVDVGLMNNLPRDPKPTTSTGWSFCQDYGYKKDWHNAGDSLANDIAAKFGALGDRTFMLYIATELPSDTTTLKHPANQDFYSTTGTSWCGGIRGYGYIYGQKK